MNPHDHNEDAEFEDFLNGESDLARRLQGMPQPQVPEALSAAILARAAADAGGAQRDGSANDAVHDAAPASPPARHYLRRARVPLGLAASVVLALFLARGLAPQAVMQETAQPAPVIVAVAPAPAATPPSLAELAVPVPAPSAKPPRPKRSAPTPEAPVVAAADAVAPQAEPVIASAAPAPPPPAPLMYAEAASKSAAPDYPSPVVVAGSRIALPAPAAAPPPAPVAAFARAAAPVVLPPAAPSSWLTRIDDLLKAGNAKEAQAEWLKFRLRYPQVEVPPELRRRLDALD
jgi:hypothetical protein